MPMLPVRNPRVSISKIAQGAGAMAEHPTKTLMPPISLYARAVNALMLP